MIVIETIAGIAIIGGLFAANAVIFNLCDKYDWESLRYHNALCIPVLIAVLLLTVEYGTPNLTTFNIPFVG